MKKNKFNYTFWSVIMLPVLMWAGVILDVIYAWIIGPEWLSYLIKAFVGYKIVKSSFFWELLQVMYSEKLPKSKALKK